MSKMVKKWFEDFLFSNMNDVEFSNTDSENIPFFDQPTGKWKNGDTSNVLLLSRFYLNRDILIPANRNAFMGKTHLNGFNIKIEGRLKVL